MKTKTSELLLIKYNKTTKLFLIESQYQVCTFQSYITAQIDKNS